jgi:sulfatase maturation enzyme AslB (radical SAM superfamily)
MNLRSKNFCVLPWIEKFQNLDGKRHLCCHSKIPVGPNEIDGIRTLLANQQPVPHCESCYKLDQQRTISPRLQETARWLKNPQVKSHIEQWKPGDPDHTFFYDLRFDNKCNLACITCNPVESSLWSKEMGIEIKSHSLEFDNADIVTSNKIYMAGGEPLIINKCIELLKQVAARDQQPEIVINTNLTRVDSNMQVVLQRIKNLTLVVSVDAHSQVNEYHRWPMKWKKFINNLTWARDVGCTIQFNTVLDAVSIINAAELVEIESYCDMWNLNILTGPAELQINNLPEHARDQVRNNWQKIKSSKFFTKDPVFKSRVIHASTLLDQSGSSTDLANYIAALDSRRSINHQDFLPIKLT